ncbi:MAG TPA: tetratricopeptide repeat protein [Thermoanaerobaculia bacterium]
MKKITTYFCVTILALLVAATASAQGWRGMGRIHGSVVDKSTGKAIVGAKLKLGSARADNTGPEIVTDKRGNWVAGGLIGGSWNVDVQAEGYISRSISVGVSEVDRVPAMKIELEPVPPPQPVEEPQTREAIAVGGVEITAETAAALEAANTAMKEQKWADAAVQYEKAIVALPDNMSLKTAIARAYYGAGDLKKAISHLQAVHTADTGNLTVAQLLANMLIEDGQVDAGKAMLDALPPGTMTDPTALINIGILFLNKNELNDAYKYFNDAVKLAPERPETYYYRGIALLQQKKMNEAKADFKKVVEIGPDSPEAKDAKDLLAQMK